MISLTGRFVCLRERFEMLAQKRSVVAQSWCRLDMHGNVIPRRHDTPRLLLADGSIKQLLFARDRSGKVTSMSILSAGSVISYARTH